VVNFLSEQSEAADQDALSGVASVPPQFQDPADDHERHKQKESTEFDQGRTSVIGNERAQNSDIPRESSAFDTEGDNGASTMSGRDVKVRIGRMLSFKKQWHHQGMRS